MNKTWIAAVILMGCLIQTQGAFAESNLRLGVGVNYWTVVDNIDVDHIDKDGVSWLATSQYKLSELLKFEADLEVFPDGFKGTDDTVYAPQVYLVLGSTIYGAAGIGILYADDDFSDEAFYALRAGLDLEIIPQFFLDLNANYRFVGTSDLEEQAKNIDWDTITLGAALRVEF